jgi:hypothetical protein
MKKNKKIRLVEEVVRMMKAENPDRVIDHNAVNSWVMGQFGRDDYNWGKFGSLRQGDISLYFKHFHNVD